MRSWGLPKSVVRHQGMGDKLLLSGVVDPAVLNGEYHQTGTLNGKPRYRKVGDESCRIVYSTVYGGPRWVLVTGGGELRRRERGSRRGGG